MSTQTDEDVARLVQEGDEQALAELINRYEGKLLRYGRRFLPHEHDIEDTVQDVFIAAYENIKDFDATRKFSPWIYRIAHNAFVNVLRAKAHGPVYLEDLDRIVPHAIYENPAAKEKEFEEMRVFVEKGVDDLSPHYREVVLLYYFENFSYQEISDILHIPMGTVGVRLARAREALKKLLMPKTETYYE